ncbi:alginate lyase family protein [Uliginosibacterium sp. sgz301328]|uniref:alginate lyase family protein n=1 Tax=Uliginosibacterium sp. sgz301328 TaxID=3243764 RepID=UPI00359ECC6F
MTYPLSFDIAAYERDRLVCNAMAALGAPVRSIVQSVNPRSPGSPHDFSSEADYWWPDPDNPEGPYIQRDGLTNPDNFTAHRELMIDFARDVGALAGAWLVNGDARFIDAARRHLMAWFVDPATRMNPDLQYAQAIKGVCTGRGIGIIDTVHLAEVALAVKAAHAVGGIPDSEFGAIQAWFADYLAWISTHPYGVAESNWHNNHGTCWALQAAAFAHLTGNAAALADCRRRLLEVLMPQQMAANGGFPKELARTKPFGYSIFNLDVMSALAQLLSTPDENLLRHELPDGRSMVRGIEFLAPFLADKDTWPGAEDVMYWDEWPVRQPALLFGALSAGREDWLALWQRLPADPEVFEVRRNYPVRNPSIWLAVVPLAR